MKKVAMLFFISLLTVSFITTSVYSATINETDTELCEAYKHALIKSLREPIDKAITEIYRDDQDAPEGLTWNTGRRVGSKGTADSLGSRRKCACWGDRKHSVFVERGRDF